MINSSFFRIFGSFASSTFFCNAVDLPLINQPRMTEINDFHKCRLFYISQNFSATYLPFSLTLSTTVFPQEVCYELTSYDDVRAMSRVRKGCRLVSKCTPEMYLVASGFCDNQTCIRCVDRHYSCNEAPGLSITIVTSLEIEDFHK